MSTHWTGVVDQRDAEIATLRAEIAATNRELDRIQGIAIERGTELLYVRDSLNFTTGLLNQLYDIATRALAEPDEGTATLVAICTEIEAARGR